MKLEKIPVNDKITASCQTKFVSQTSYQWLQQTKMNFEKLLGGQVFKNHNYNPLHSSSSFSIPASYSICGVIYTFFKLFERLCISQFQLPPPLLPHGYCGAFAYLFSPGGGAFAIFALLGDRAFANPRAIPELLTRTLYAFALFFRPHPGWFDNWRVPTPGNLVPSQKKIANARESAGGGGGGRGKVAWGQLGAAGIDWCNILMIHSISVVAIRTVWVLILNFVTHLL